MNPQAESSEILNPFRGLVEKIHSALDEIDNRTKIIQKQISPSSEKVNESPQTEMDRILSEIFSHAKQIQDKLI